MRVLFSFIILSFFSVKASATDFAEWIKLEQRRSLNFLYQNISAPTTASGSVIASPSKSNPNYFFHWVRDAALVMDPVIRIFLSTKDAAVKQKIFNQVHQYVLFSRKLQVTPNLSQGLGEPKFYPDGQAFDGPWGRPQNDGPALRALSLTRYAKHLLDLDHRDYVEQFLYDSVEPSETLIKADLDFLVSRWKQKSFDLWEEVLGDHFYTRIVQRRALLDGAELAGKLNDHASAQLYRETAVAIQAEIERHWNPEKGVIVPSLNVAAGVLKPMGVDTSVILGCIHGLGGDGFFGPTDDRMLATAGKIISVFRNLYPINFDFNGLAPAIGRYPEDTYDGVNNNSQGHPWFLTTLAMAEFTYYAKREFLKVGSIKISELNLTFFRWVLPDEDFQPGMEISRGEPLWDDLMEGLLKLGDRFLGRVAFHVNRQTGEMSEQFDRESGFMRGANHLSWSYAGFLTASWVRRVALAR